MHARRSSSARALELAFAQNALAPTVATACLRIGDYTAELHPVETSYVARAVPRRQHEFATGRACARRALSRLGIASCPIPAGAMREPLWPSGISGSITHDGDYCVAAAARSSSLPLFGIDLALGKHLPAELASMICTDAEIDCARRASVPGGCDPAKLIFSIKESVYKCVFPLVRTVFDFHDVRVLLHPAHRGAYVELANPELFANVRVAVRARYWLLGDYVFSAAWARDKRAARSS